jgi:hypothetical protein
MARILTNGSKNAVKSGKKVVSKVAPKAAKKNKRTEDTEWEITYRCTRITKGAYFFQPLDDDGEVIEDMGETTFGPIYGRKDNLNAEFTEGDEIIVPFRRA